MINNIIRTSAWLFLLLCSACNTEKLSVTVIRDVTDSNMSYPKSKEVYSMFDLQENTLKGIDFRLTLIADVEYGPEYNLQLLGQNEFATNELERKREIRNFKKEVDSLINIPQKQSRDYSVVFPVVIREINRLMKNAASTKKVLIIYSDLLENTDQISFLKAESGQQKEKQGTGLWTELEGNYNTRIVSNLHGLDVYFVYQAKDIHSSHKFSPISTLYRQQLEQRGARVMITANL